MTARRFILALAGGVGGGKLAQGLAAALPPEELAIVVNTADDFVHLGLNISPDIDSVLYAVAGLNDPERGWGLAGESWNFMAALERLGGETWFKLGDRDLATHMLRSHALAAGRTLSDVTAMLARQLGVAHTIAPMSDDPIRSVVLTSDGALDFQDYFVRRQCQPAYRGLDIRGAATARPSDVLRDALDRAQAIIIAPSNPLASIDPMLAVPGVAGALRRSGRPVVAVSPIVGGRAVKGPLAKMMHERGQEPSALGVAQHYGRLIDGWIVDTADRPLVPAIKALGCRVIVRDIIMHTLDEKRRLAQDALEFASDLSRVPVD